MCMCVCTVSTGSADVGPSFVFMFLVMSCLTEKFAFQCLAPHVLTSQIRV